MTDLPWATDEVAEELASAIDESMDMDWQSSWAVPHLVPIIDRLLAEREAETIERCAQVADKIAGYYSTAAGGPTSRAIMPRLQVERLDSARDAAASIAQTLRALRPSDLATHLPNEV